MDGVDRAWRPPTCISLINDYLRTSNFFLPSYLHLNYIFFKLIYVNLRLWFRDTKYVLIYCSRINLLNHLTSKKIDTSRIIPFNFDEESKKISSIYIRNVYIHLFITLFNSVVYP